MFIFGFSPLHLTTHYYASYWNFYSKVVLCAWMKKFRSFLNQKYKTINCKKNKNIIFESLIVLV
jgi:hypothetical protein